MFEALNEFIAIVADAAPWLLPFVVLLVWWGFTNWQVLNSPEKKESFAWAITQLKENNWGKRYLHSLGWLLDRVGIWIGDREKLDQIYITPNNPKNFILKTFGFNPFTPESYEKCLKLAFFYPLFSVIIVWVINGSDQIGTTELLGGRITNLSVWQRWLLIPITLTVIWLNILLLPFRSGWKRWIVLIQLSFINGAVAASSLNEAAITSFLNEVVPASVLNTSPLDIWVIIVLIILYLKLWVVLVILYWLLFLVAFFPMYFGGVIAGITLRLSKKIAHKLIYLKSLTLAHVISIAILYMMAESNFEVVEVLIKNAIPVVNENSVKLHYPPIR